MAGAACQEVRSTCPYCGTGCGVLLRPDGAGGLAVRGDPDHPANRGRLCSKGLALGETLGLEGRLLAPQVNGQQTDWDSALDLVAARFRQAVEQHGPDSVGFYLSGQMLTEDYYVANKLMKGFLGSANIDTNSRLCMASTVAGHKRAFGTDTVPGTYEDLDEADLIVLVGSNLAWCHPVLHQRILAAREARGTRLVVIDPRRTASCDQADMHLKLRAGSDVALFNRLLAALHEGGALDAEYLRHVNGLGEALDAAFAADAAVTGLESSEIAAFCELWMRTDKVVTIFSQGVNQSTSGTDKVNAILNCHLASGRIGKPGCGPFSVTGQPNAMGGREVGGLANMLACHMDLENSGHRAAVQEFWDAPAMPERAGLKAVDLFRAAGDGRLKALWIIHTNPAVTMPEADAVAAAIKTCEFTVVSDITAATDTARLADVLLPAAGWAEKDGTVTNSDRTISRQRAALPPPGEARADWDILADAGRRMGWGAAFDYQSPAQIFREHAALSGLAGSFGLDFDISGLSGLSDSDYEGLRPVRWPVSRSRQGGRFFADGQFFHPDGKARMLPVRCRPPAASQDRQYPFRLNTGRIRDQWHTMTRTGKAPRLSAHLAEPFADIHPEDARRLGVQPADLLRLSSPHGQAILRARITADVQPGDLFVPIHWTGETAPSARIDTLVAAAVDPVSGQPESKAAVVAAERWQAAWYGFAVSRRPMAPRTDYWAMTRTKTGYRAELAGSPPLGDAEAAARTLFAMPDAELQMMTDSSRGITRLALCRDGRVQAALFTAPEPVAVSRDYLAGLPGTCASGILTGVPAADQPDPGPLVCACFNVGASSILQAIETGGLLSVADVGAALQAGTNCGSCRSDIAALLARAAVPHAAE
ncbi:molybdopterin-dependent oxidoreductase [Leisingera aquaemixtae]|uniref:nitrate reductase n=1 Tax=Leisingera aquaemixtae TaxID=1396826 RepID=UPI001C97277F|nr:nitrate reductase [Leisingera aquaemixtae]MBY6067959.1 molybdopterin-dependent oxidoreductase [Leisingera aquaemixtae]